jgi:peptidyl-prolyl cis-trans isomerase SurA
LLAATESFAMELDRIIAVVDEDVIMQSELDLQLRKVRNELRHQGTEVPPTSVLERQVMERLVLQKIQLQQASRSKIEVTDDALDRTIEDIAKRNKVSIAQFKEILEADGYAFDKFREEIRNEITIARLRKQEVENRVQVTDAEIDAYLKNESQQTGDESEIRLSHILISVPTNATEAERQNAKAKADAVYARLESGEDFGQVAIAASDAPDALEKGDLGWRKSDQVPSLFADAVRSLEIDHYGPVITSPTGYHIVKLTGRRQGDRIMVDQTHCRHILITPNQRVSEQDAVSRLQQLRMRLEAGDDFATLARTHSDDRGSALEGGDLGWVSKGQMVPDFEEVMLLTEPGEISKPFRTQFGWHILQVLERRSYDGTDEVRRSKAREAIGQRKKDDFLQEWLRRLRDEAYVEIRVDEP